MKKIWALKIEEFFSKDLNKKFTYL